MREHVRASRSLFDPRRDQWKARSLHLKAMSGVMGATLDTKGLVLTHLDLFWGPLGVHIEPLLAYLGALTYFGGLLGSISTQLDLFGGPLGVHVKPLLAHLGPMLDKLATASARNACTCIEGLGMHVRAKNVIKRALAIYPLLRTCALHPPRPR